MRVSECKIELAFFAEREHLRSLSTAKISKKCQTKEACSENIHIIAEKIYMGMLLKSVPLQQISKTKTYEEDSDNNCADDGDNYYAISNESR